MADAASNIELAQMLANATNDRWTMRGINLEIANDAVKRLLDAERKTNATFHVRYTFADANCSIVYIGHLLWDTIVENFWGRFSV